MLYMQGPRIILDTNLLVAAMRSRRGASSLLLSLAGTGRFTLHISVPLVLEYEEVLLRQRREIGLSETEVARYVDAICAVAEKHEIYFLWRPTLQDADDEILLELAMAAQCDYIVTYNKRDFAGAEQFAVEIVTPKEFLQEIGELS